MSKLIFTLFVVATLLFIFGVTSYFYLRPEPVQVQSAANYYT